jgi:hypothetical protein
MMRRRLLAAAVMALLVAPPIAAQPPRPQGRGTKKPKPPGPINPFDTGGIRGGKLAKLGGTVVDQAGHGVPRVTIVLASADAPAKRVTTTTDRSGRFLVPVGLPAGGFTLEATIPRFARTKMTGVRVDADDVTITVPLKSGRPAEAWDIALAEIEGRVTSPDGPADGARVTVRSVAGAGAAATTMTTAFGNYRLANLLPGSYELAVEAKGYRDYRAIVTIPHQGTLEVELSK